MSTDPVRVLSLIKGLGPGGAEQLLLLSVRVTDPRRVRHQVLFLRPDKTHLVPEFAALGIVPHRLPEGRIAALRALRRALAETDIAHVHSPVLAGITRLLARTVPARRRPAVITTEHNEWTSHHRATRLLNGLTQPLDAHTWAVSDRVRETVWPPLRRRYEVLTHGIDTHERVEEPRARAEVREELGLSADAVLVVTVANHRHNKDYPNLLAAADTVLTAQPQVHFAAIGQGPLTEAIRRERDARGLADRFALLGFRRDVHDILRAADIFVLASAHEGLPVAVMEAFAAGLPVVATAVGGVPRQVRDGVEGLIVPPGDPQALAEALLRVVRDPVLRGELAERAALRAAEFDIRAAVAAHTTVYEDLRRRA